MKKRPSLTITIAQVDKPKGKDMINDEMPPEPKPDPMMEAEPAYDDAGANLIEIGEGTFENMEDGMPVEFSGTGKLVKKPDGSFCIQVESIEGVPVTQEVEQDDAGDVESAKKGLMSSIQNQGGYNNSIE